MLSLQTKNKKLKRLIDLKVKNSNINNFSVPVINLSCINRKNIYCFIIYNFFFIYIKMSFENIIFKIIQVIFKQY